MLKSITLFIIVILSTAVFSENPFVPLDPDKYLEAPSLDKDECLLCPFEESPDPKLIKMLDDALDVYNEDIRDQKTGQYLDEISIDENKPTTKTNASIATAGMGLITLTIADRIGKDPKAREKVILTLKNALGKKKDFMAKRSKHGWFRHWYDVKTGEDNDWSKNDGFSTIDTAIFVAGAQFAANYFKDDQEINKLAKEALQTVDWESAIVDEKKGTLALKFELNSEERKGETSPFNEYLLLACMGKLKEDKNQKAGVMTKFWNEHFSQVDKLPKSDYQGTKTLTDLPGHFLSNFVMQFTMYLCGDVANSKEYLKEWEKMTDADQAWFRSQNFPEGLWGLGAGEVRHTLPDGSIGQYYKANKIGDNPHCVISPAIMAGAIPVAPRAADDLLKLYESNACRYVYRYRDVMWRASLKEPEIPYENLQSIDYSTFILGLATVHPKIGGFKFFQDTLKGPPIINE